jgi:hypothetical protein
VFFLCFVFFWRDIEYVTRVHHLEESWLVFLLVLRTSAHQRRRQKTQKNRREIEDKRSKRASALSQAAHKTCCAPEMDETCLGGREGAWRGLNQENWMFFWMRIGGFVGCGGALHPMGPQKNKRIDGWMGLWWLTEL